jgi:hypothetical protein
MANLTIIALNGADGGQVLNNVPKGLGAVITDPTLLKELNTAPPSPAYAVQSSQNSYIPAQPAANNSSPPGLGAVVTDPKLLQQLNASDNTVQSPVSKNITPTSSNIDNSSILDKIGRFIEAGGAGAATGLQKQISSIGMPNKMLAEISPQYEQAVHYARNVNIPNALGIPKTTANTVAENIGQWTPTVIGGIEGAAKLSDAVVPALKSLLVGKNSQQLADKALTFLPELQNLNYAAAQKEYGKAFDYLDGLKNKVDINPHVVNNPETQSMFGKITNPSENEQFVKNNSYLKNNYPELFDNPNMPHIFNDEDRTQFRTGTKRIYSKFMNNPNGRNLLDLRSQLGSDIAASPYDTAANRDYVDSLSRARDKTDQMMEQHLAQDNSGKALQGFRNGNKIMSQHYYPLLNSPFHSAIVKGNVESMTPQEYLTKTRNAVINEQIPKGHPANSLAKKIQLRLEKESKPANKLKKALGYTGVGLLGGLGVGAGSGLGHSLYKDLF